MEVDDLDADPADQKPKFKVNDAGSEEDDDFVTITPYDKKFK